MTGLKSDEVKVVPILLRPCQWKESRFSELQLIPRNAKAITSWSSTDEALNDVADEIRNIVSGSPPSSPRPSFDPDKSHPLESSLDLVRAQVRCYARLYERTRQRMRPSPERTQRMEEIFGKMRSVATASYPLLGELTKSFSPGETLGCSGNPAGVCLRAISSISCEFGRLRKTVCGVSCCKSASLRSWLLGSTYVLAAIGSNTVSTGGVELSQRWVRYGPSDGIKGSRRRTSKHHRSAVRSCGRRTRLIARPTKFLP